jgi:hypothetical protein
MPTLPTDLERLTQAATIVRTCISAHDNDVELECDIAPALRVVVTLLEDTNDDESLPDASHTTLCEAAGVVKVVCIAADCPEHDVNLSWPLEVAARLIHEVISRLPP